MTLAVANSVKIAEEVEELNGVGGEQRKDSKYMFVDELTDVAVMVGVYLFFFSSRHTSVSLRRLSIW